MALLSVVFNLRKIFRLKMICGGDIVIEHYSELRKAKRNFCCLKSMSLRSTETIYVVFIRGRMKRSTTELL